MRAEYLPVTVQGFLRLCHLLFACPCAERHSSSTAGEILPWSCKCHGNKLTQTAWDFQLLAFTNLSGFALPEDLDLLTPVEKN